MKKLLVLGLVLLVAAAFIVPAVSATKTVGNGMLNGPHYNLNIIGAKNSKDVGDSAGHTLFVKLNGHTKIYMTQDDDGEFYVVDRDGTDGTAEFNIAPGHYNVYARALGKPGGKVDIYANASFEDAVDGVKLVNLGFVNLARDGKKPQSVNINNLFYVDVTLCTEAELGICTETTTYDDYWVFDIEELLEYWWDYWNNDLKLLQVRFYECTLDSTGEADDYCRWGDGSPIESKKTVVSA
jgi:hypothetical protein